MSFLTELNYDSLLIIQMILRPRHLINLMLSNKAIYKVLTENKYYWERVAAHLVWRGEIIGMPMYEPPGDRLAPAEGLGALERLLQQHGLPGAPNVDLDVEPPPKYTGYENGYYEMVLLPHGYHHAMEHFMEMITMRMKETQLVDPDGPKDGPREDYFEWNHLANADLDVKIRTLMTISVKKEKYVWSCNGKYKLDEIPTLTVRMICRREMDAITNNKMRYNKKIYTLIHEIDDDPLIPIASKKRLGHNIIKAFSSSTDTYSVAMQAFMGLPIDRKKLEEIKREQTLVGMWLQNYMAGFAL
jgi:hypothetical protein